ncbi:unnamed protein product [Mucor hiemalis]
MSNLFSDPFGIKLMKCNRPKEEETAPEDPEATQEVHYYYPSCNYPAFQPYYPIAAPTMIMMHQQSVVYHLPQPFYYTAPHPVAPEPPKPHQCVSCTSERKCKACKKEESKNSKKVIKPNWSNPRT